MSESQGFLTRFRNWQRNRPCAHNWGFGDIIAPTREQLKTWPSPSVGPGMRILTCKKCGDTRTENCKVAYGGYEPGTSPRRGATGPLSGPLERMGL